MTSTQSASSHHAVNDRIVNRRQRVNVAAIGFFAAFVVFAAHNLVAFDAIRMASVSFFAALMSLAALATLHIRQKIDRAANFLVGALVIQIFGEMAVNGGLSAPATPLAPLIVPAAYLLSPNDPRGLRGWIFTVAVLLTVIGILEQYELTMVNEMSEQAQRFDKLMTLLIGFVGAASLTGLFAAQATRAFRQLEAERQAFRNQALFDGLTGLPNRTHFFDRARQMLENASKKSQTCELVFIDIDHFKQINDNYGHATGDALLLQVGKLLDSENTKDCIAARLSGDEFVIMVCRDQAVRDSDSLLSVGAKLRNSPFALDDKMRFVGFSAGMARYPQDGTTLKTLMNIADQKMYQSKRKKNQQLASDQVKTGDLAESDIVGQ